MRISEIFYSIQGEGPAMGRPATFIRTAGCNLKCKGCDTHLAHWKAMTLPDILEKIIGNRVVITGGEPTLQGEELIDLIDLLHDHAVEIHIETNGTNIIPDEALKKIHCAVVSPKRGSEFNLEYWRNRDNVHLKFVLGPEAWCWSQELLEVLVLSVLRERVWLMPYGTSKEMRSAQDAWDLALRLGANYSDRLHIRMRRP